MKNKSHKRVVYTRINPLSVGIALVIGLLWSCTPAQYDDVYVAEPEVTPIVKVEAKELTKAEIESKIREYFPRSYKTMIPIAYAESGLRPTAQNWNCYYNKDETIVYTTRVKGSHGAACKKGHRQYSFGVDCFVLQKHYRGLKECPKDISLDEHLKEVAELSRTQSFAAWSAYNNKSYLAYTK